MANVPAPIVVPTNPADLAKIKKELEEISSVMTMIEAKREFISEALKGLSENFDIPAKYVRRMAKTFHKRTFHQEASEMSDFESLYFAVTGESPN